MAVKLNAVFGNRTINTPGAPRVAAPTDFGLSSLANTISDISARQNLKLSKTANDAEYEAKRAQEKAQAKIEAEQERKKAEADGLALTVEIDKFSEFGTDLFKTETDAGNTVKPNWVDEYDKALQSKIKEHIDKLPEDLKGEAQIQFEKTRHSLVQTYKGDAINARLAHVTNEAATSLQQMVNKSISNPRQLVEKMAAADTLIDGLLDLTPDQKEKMKKSTHAQMTQGALLTRLMVNPRSITAELNSGKWDSFLDSNDKQQLLSHADSRAKQLDAEARAREEERRREQARLREEARQREALAAYKHSLFKQEQAPIMAKLVDDNLKSIQMTGRSIAGAPTKAQIHDILGPNAAVNYEHNLSVATKVSQFSIRGAVLSSGQLQSELLKLKPKGGEKNFGDMLEVYQTASKIAAGIQEYRQKDPAGYWLGLDSTQQDIQADMKKNNLSYEQSKARMLTYLQKNIGGAPDGQIWVLTMDEAKSMAAQVSTGNWEHDSKNAIKIVDNIKRTYGNQSGYALNNLAFASKNPSLATLAMVPDKNKDAAAGLLFAAPKNKVDKNKQQEIDRSVKSIIAPLLRSMPNNGAQNNDVILQGVSKMATNLYASGDAHQGFNNLSSSDAARQASNYFMNQYTFKGSLRIPQNIPVSNAMSGTAKLKNQMVGDYKLFAPMAGNAAMSVEERQKLTANDVRKNGHWVATNDDSGVMLVGKDGGVYRLYNGQPAIFTWDKLLSNWGH